MLNAVLRLLTISLSVLIVGFVAVFAVRRLSLGQNYVPPPHPFFQMDTWKIARPTTDNPCLTEAPSPEWILFERVGQAKDGSWQSLTCHSPLLQRLGQSRHRNWLLQVNMADNHGLDELVKVLNAFDREKSFAIYAPAQQAARYLRKQGPQWAFAADAASLTRLHLFTSLWLEPALEFWPDFVLFSGDPQDGSALNEREILEITRRKKRYVVPSAP